MLNLANSLFSIQIGLTMLLPALPYISRWVKRRYYRHSIVVNERCLYHDFAGAKRQSTLKRLRENIAGNRHVHPWRRLDDELRAWLTEESVSHWFDFMSVDAYAAGRLHFRNESDRAYFVMRFYHLAVLEHD